MACRVTVTILNLGNGPAVPLPRSIAHSAQLTVGQTVELTVRDDCVMVKPTGAPKLTLEEKLR